MNKDSSARPLIAKAVFDQPYSTGRIAHPSQCLDLYLPEGSGPFPLAIWIHGGGWAQCDKRLDFAPEFLRRGLALASIDYRLTSEGFPFPSQIEDCLSALSWMREHGKKWGIDPGRIGLIGHSAGAHLAALLASVCTTGHFGAGNCPGVQAVAGLSGPYDLGRERADWPGEYFVWNPDDQFCTKFFAAGVYDEASARRASPASYLRQHLPPMLIVHGARDNIVPMAQAEAYAKSLADWGGEVLFHPIPQANHDLLPEHICQAAEFLAHKLLRRD